MGEENEGKKKKLSSEDDVEDVSFDGSGLNYDMDGFSGKINGGNRSNAISNVTGGEQKLRAKGLLYYFVSTESMPWPRHFLRKKKMLRSNFEFLSIWPLMLGFFFFPPKLIPWPLPVIFSGSVPTCIRGAAGRSSVKAATDSSPWFRILAK